MKKLIPLLLVATLIACGGGSSTPPAGSIKVDGDIKNDTIVWHNYLPDFFKKAFAIDTISTRSTLTVTDPIRLDDISIATGIVVNADVINTTASRIEGYSVTIYVEHENFLTKETWMCQVCYPITGGTECEGLYTVEGNTIFETDPAPTLPACDSTTGSPALCVTQFLNDPDCSQPSYVIDYQEAGDGLWKAFIPGVTVEALSSLVNSIGMADSGMLTGANKYARFILFNENNVQVAQKDYVFNVIN